jgi:hypothetical protein
LRKEIKTCRKKEVRDRGETIGRAFILGFVRERKDSVVGLEKKHGRRRDVFVFKFCKLSYRVIFFYFLGAGEFGFFFT